MPPTPRAQLLLRDILAGEDLRSLLACVMDGEGRVRVDALVQLALEEEEQEEDEDEDHV